MIVSELVKLNPSALVELYELNVRDLPNYEPFEFELGLPEEDQGIYRFYSWGLNELENALVWKGKNYEPYPLEVRGFSLEGEKQIPRPILTISNLGTIVQELVYKYDDILGGKLTRKRTFARFLDEDNFTAEPLTNQPYMVYQDAVTNYFLNSFAPATQDITVDGTYIVWVLGGGSITLSNVASGIVTEGDPIVFTGTGTLTCTYSAVLTHVQVEEGNQQNGPVTTVGTPGTSDKTIITYNEFNWSSSRGPVYLEFNYANDIVNIIILGSTTILGTRLPNLILNGTFDTDLSDWIIDDPDGTSWDSSSIKLVYDDNGDNVQIRQTPGTVKTGAIYTLEWDQTITSGTRIKVNYRNAANTDDVHTSTYYDGTGHMIEENITSDTGLQIQMFIEATGDIVNLDNIICTELSDTKELYLTDSVNTVVLPITEGEHTCEIEYSCVDLTMKLTLDTTAYSSYTFTGTWPTGDITIEENIRELKRYNIECTHVPKINGATYNPTTFELAQELIGAGAIVTHEETIYSLDVDGIYHAFGFDEPVWIGMRESGGSYYADDGGGTLLDPLPCLVYQDAATNSLLQSHCIDATSALATDEWRGNTNTNVTLNSISSPSGNVDATLVNPTVNNGNDFVYRYTTYDNRVATVKFWVKGTVDEQIYYFCNSGIGTSDSQTLHTFSGDWEIVTFYEENTSTGTKYMGFQTLGLGAYPDLPTNITFYFWQGEMHLDKLEIDIIDTGPIFTTGTAATTDEIINRWPAALHNNDGEQYIFDIDYTGGYVVVFSLDVQDVLYTESDGSGGKQLVLTDGINHCIIPIITGRHHVEIEYGELALKLILNGASKQTVYDKILGVGDIIVKENISLFQRFDPVPAVDIDFHAATVMGEFLKLTQQYVGVGTPSCLHSSDIYIPDYLGVYQKFGTDTVIWKEARCIVDESDYVTDAYADEGGSNPDADATAEFPDTVYYIRKKNSEDILATSFELSSPWDVEGVKLPRRVMNSDICPWLYRGADCGYVGSAFFTTKDEPTEDSELDVCGKRLESCLLRFSGGQPANFGGFPALSND